MSANDHCLTKITYRWDTSFNEVKTADIPPITISVFNNLHCRTFSKAGCWNSPSNYISSWGGWSSCIKRNAMNFFKKCLLEWVLRGIVWIFTSCVPYTSFKIHNFCPCMIHTFCFCIIKVKILGVPGGTTGCQRLTKVWSQVNDIVMSISCWICWFHF